MAKYPHIKRQIAVLLYILFSVSVIVWLIVFMSYVDVSNVDRDILIGTWSMECISSSRNGVHYIILDADGSCVLCMPRVARQHLFGTFSTKLVNQDLFENGKWEIDRNNGKLSLDMVFPYDSSNYGKGAQVHISFSICKYQGQIVLYSMVSADKPIILVCKKS
jgi:hypothetical protein